MASRDDVYMNFDKVVLLAREWQAPLVDIGHAGHINVASGFGRWVQGHELARQVAEQAGQRGQAAAGSGRAAPRPAQWV